MKFKWVFDSQIFININTFRIGDEQQLKIVDFVDSVKARDLRNKYKIQYCELWAREQKESGIIKEYSLYSKESLGKFLKLIK